MTTTNTLVENRVREYLTWHAVNDANSPLNAIAAPYQADGTAEIVTTPRVFGTFEADARIVPCVVVSAAESTAVSGFDTFDRIDDVRLYVSVIGNPNDETEETLRARVAEIHRLMSGDGLAEALSDEALGVYYIKPEQKTDLDSPIGDVGDNWSEHLRYKITAQGRD
jgi:hypothetical protein